MIYDKNYYYEQYSKNGVYAKISDNRSYAVNYATNVTDNVVDFLRGKNDLKYFSDTEQSHMHDVKLVISAMNFVYYSSAIFFIIIFIILYYLTKRERINFVEVISRILFFGSIAALAFLISIFLWSVFSFDTLFFLMHLIFFPQGNWMFSSESLLITLFPEPFFFNMALRIFIYAIFQSALFLGIALWFRKQVNMSKKYKK
jgi:integral membrane protein (TIGR01906 family)